MTESDFTRKLKKRLEEMMSYAVIWKHADMFTKGIPDLSVTVDHRTTWIENKLSTNKQIFEPLQYEQLRRVHGWYIVWDVETRKGCMFRADERELAKEPMSRMVACDLTFDELCDKLCRIL
jgi:hypothetical protein